MQRNKSKTNSSIILTLRLWFWVRLIIIYYNWLRERGCIVANPDRLRHFRLGENHLHQRLIELQDA